MISILISTIDERIEKVKNVLLNPRDDVEYIISHQYTDEVFRKIPYELQRGDVTISQIRGKGVSKSRNNAMRLAKGDVGLFADDDVTYRDEYIDILKSTFWSNPDTDLALFKIKTRPGEPAYKQYPDHKIRLNRVLFSPSTVEIAFNINRMKKAPIWFDERFGVGQELIIGAEETIFIEDCLTHGCNVIFVPEYIVEHPYCSTIKAIPKFAKQRNWVAGAYDCRRNGKIALLKALFGTLKLLPELIKYRMNPAIYFYHRLSAVIYILRTNDKQKIKKDALSVSSNVEHQSEFEPYL